MLGDVGSTPGEDLAVGLGDREESVFVEFEPPAAFVHHVVVAGADWNHVRQIGRPIVFPGEDGVPSDTAAQLELDGVPPVSVPLVLFDYLDSVQLAVRHDVGDAVFGGAVAEAADTNDVTISIYGTDVNQITYAVDRIAVDARDRITVAESRYSVSELDRFAVEAQHRLDAERIEAHVWGAWGLDAVEIRLVTPDGSPDDALEAAAIAALGDLPVLVAFASPVVPLVPDS